MHPVEWGTHTFDHNIFLIVCLGMFYYICWIIGKDMAGCRVKQTEDHIQHAVKVLKMRAGKRENFYTST